jgi:hypothetical protein
MPDIGNNEALTKAVKDLESRVKKLEPTLKKTKKKRSKTTNQSTLLRCLEDPPSSKLISANTTKN